MTGAITSILKQDAPSYSLEMSSAKLNLRRRAKIDRKRASVGDNRATRSLTDTGELSGYRTLGRRRPIMSGLSGTRPETSVTVPDSLYDSGCRNQDNELLQA